MKSDTTKARVSGTLDPIVRNIDFNLSLNVHLMSGDVSCVDVPAVQRHIDGLLDKRNDAFANARSQALRGKDG